MAKKIRFESFKYRFLCAAQEYEKELASSQAQAWEEFLKDLRFSYDKGNIVIAWERGAPDSVSVPLREAEFYVRGDTEKYISEQHAARLVNEQDAVRQRNAAYFLAAVRRVATLSGYHGSVAVTDQDTRIAKERAFHDGWASTENIETIDITAANEACTAPEMRYIARRLGDLRGKRLLDVGCGLGEASVYFTLRGADVTSADLSQSMLDATCRLAAAHGVSVRPHLAAAEDLKLPAESKFDIIYAGNLLHHVDIGQTLLRFKQHISPDGLVVTWDPLAYNPIINVYRRIATDVRTPDEHPLKWRDIQLFRRHFGRVEAEYFWLTTLVIFLTMALVQRRNPNKERFWKVVVQEGEKWRWLYDPLEKFDRLLVKVLPPLRLLCWNVVLVARVPLNVDQR